MPLKWVPGGPDELLLLKIFLELGCVLQHLFLMEALLDVFEVEAVLLFGLFHQLPLFSEGFDLIKFLLPFLL